MFSSPPPTPSSTYIHTQHRRDDEDGNDNNEYGRDVGKTEGNLNGELKNISSKVSHLILYGVSLSAWLFF